MHLPPGRPTKCLLYSASFAVPTLLRRALSLNNEISNSSDIALSKHGSSCLYVPKNVGTAGTCIRNTANSEEL